MACRKLYELFPFHSCSSVYSGAQKYTKMHRRLSLKLKDENSIGGITDSRKLKLHPGNVKTTETH